MKKLTFTALGIIMNIMIFAEVQLPPIFGVPDAELRLPILLDDLFMQTYSLKAQELLWYYTPRKNPQAWAPYPPKIITPMYHSRNKEKHYNEEYRPAWEELYRDYITNDHNRKLHQMGIYGIALALSEIASTNSIPMLVSIYTQILEINNDVNQELQMITFGILFNIDAPEALDAIFSLLDLSDAKYIDANPPEKTRTGLTLREWVWQDRLDPNYTSSGFISRQERITRAEHWRKKINAYQNSKLSENNKMFMEKARNLSRTPEERNTSADVPLP